MSELAILPKPEALPISQPRTTMDMVQEAVMRGAPLEMVDKLIGFHERLKATQARSEFDEAMAAAKAEIPVIKKTSHVGFNSKDPSKGKTDYDHETLGEIAKTIDPILGKHGLSYRFRIAQTPQITVTCVIAHRAGHSEETELSAGPDATGNKNSIQAIGSTITYLQRYLLKSALGLAAAKDDDGQAACTSDALISEEQVLELIDLADDAGVDKRRFCKFFKIESFADIRVSQIDKAKKAIEAKRRAVANA